MTPMGIFGLISDVCPFILSNLLEGTPYSICLGLLFKPRRGLCRVWQWKQAQRLLGIQLSKQMF